MSLDDGIAEDLAMILCWQQAGSEPQVKPETIFKQMHPKARDAFRRQATEIVEMLPLFGLVLKAPSPTDED